ncbi:MAG TPA: hypothetical protein PK280_02175 [Planctomycetota bacterium]|nr:hypothetical protein [Planctomycetota bacterium]
MADLAKARYTIDPSKYRSYNSYAWWLIIIWLVWAPMTAVVTYLAVTRLDAFLFVWLLFGYLGTVAVPYAIYNRRRRQVLEVDGDSLVIYGAGILPRSKVRIEKNNLQALTLELHESTDGSESVYSLNLLSQQGVWQNRVHLAPFVHPADQAILLEEIKAFLERHGFLFSVKNGFSQPTPPEPKP